MSHNSNRATSLAKRITMGLGALMLASTAFSAVAEARSVSISNEFYPRQVGSWGGKIRSGPGMQYRQVGSTFEGQNVTLQQNSGQWMNGYPWFRITLPNGQRGYQWGGIMCGLNENVQGLHRVCRWTQNNNNNGGGGFSGNNNGGGFNGNNNNNGGGFNGNNNNGGGGVTGAGERIQYYTLRFAPGTSSTNVNGGFARGGRAVYTINARGGQDMAINVGSVERNATFSIYYGGENGTPVGNSNDQWNGVLPYSGNYSIVVESLRGGTSYNMFVEIR